VTSVCLMLLGAHDCTRRLCTMVDGDS